MSLFKVYAFALIASLAWGLFPGISGETIEMAGGDFEVYTLGVVVIALITGLASKKLAMLTGSLYCNAFAFTYLIAAIVKLSTLSDIDMVYMISNTFFGTITYISITMVLLDGSSRLHS